LTYVKLSPSLKYCRNKHICNKSKPFYFTLIVQVRVPIVSQGHQLLQGHSQGRLKVEHGVERESLGLREVREAGKQRN